jgi:hypothetical protein
MIPTRPLPIMRFLPRIFGRSSKAIAIQQAQSGIVHWVPKPALTEEDYPEPATMVCLPLRLHIQWDSRADDQP